MPSLRSLRPLLASLLLLPAFAQAEADADSKLNINLKDGLIFTTGDGASSVRLTGYFQFDYNFYDGGYNAQGNGQSSQSEIRRSRFGVEGVFEHDWEYEFLLNVDDNNRSANIDTASVRYGGLPHWGFTLGRFKRPVGLEVLGSARWLTTASRALIFDIAPANDVAQSGLMADGRYGDFRLWLGGFNTGVEDYDSKQDRYGLYARGTFGHVFKNGSLVHLGVSVADQNAAPRTPATLTSRFGVHTLPFDMFQFANELNDQRQRTAFLEVDQDQQIALEAAFAYDAFSIQAEALHRELKRSSAGVFGRNALDDVYGNTINADGGYVQLAYTLTGQTREYKKGPATFGALAPTGRYGAVEAVLKADYVEAANGDVQLYTAGVNWMPNYYFRFLLDYLRYNSSGLAKGNAFNNQGSAVVGRFQFQF
jgi:phosphate-selective porin OprO/OprP